MGQANHHNGPLNSRREIARSLARAQSTQLTATRSTDASSREVTMGTKRLSAVLWVLAIVSCATVWAGDSVEASSAATEFSPTSDAAAAGASSIQSAPIEPWIHPLMPREIREKLGVAFEIAIQRINDVPECAGLFSRLHADALETLKTGLYFPANVARETSVCSRSFAQTYVGEPPTWICRRITSYSDEQAAMVVIHEALHHAGLPERPQDKKAMTSGQINDLVSGACGL